MIFLDWLSGVLVGALIYIVSREISRKMFGDGFAAFFMTVAIGGLAIFFDITDNC